MRSAVSACSCKQASSAGSIRAARSSAPLPQLGQPQGRASPAFRRGNRDSGSPKRYPPFQALRSLPCSKCLRQYPQHKSRGHHGPMYMIVVLRPGEVVVEGRRLAARPP